MKVNLMSTKSRNYFLDNYKALLIVLVVIGHFIEPCYENNDFLTILKWVIFSFHMPAFIFISGFFSKKDITLGKLIQKLVIPYFVFELLYYLLYVFVIHKETGLYFNRPKFSLWYLMSLFFWRIITPYIRKIPGNLFIAITGGLLIGLTQLGNFFSIPRTLFFYPFFLGRLLFPGRMVSGPAKTPEAFGRCSFWRHRVCPVCCKNCRVEFVSLYFLWTLFLRRYGDLRHHWNSNPSGLLRNFLPGPFHCLRG